MHEERHSGRSDGALDGLRRSIQVEAAAIRAYERYLATLGDVTPDPSLLTIAVSHQRRHSSLEALMFSYRRDVTMSWDLRPTGPFSDLLNEWERATRSLVALSVCERRTLTWYYEESERQESFIAHLITDQLMPEQTRTSTMMGGLARRGLLA